MTTENKTKKKSKNICRVHGTKRLSAYYDYDNDGNFIDILVFKCRTKNCTEGHEIIEGYETAKEERRQKKLKEKTKKALKKISEEESVTN